MEEIWKTVEATKGHYEVSNLGNVRKDGEIVEPHEDANGYMKVKNCIDLWNYENMATQISSYNIYRKSRK